MSDEEVMSFEITDHDVDHEFTQHRTRKLTKHQQIYGIWADNDEDDSEDEKPSSAKYSRKKKDYSAPVNFVAGGIHQPGQKPKEEEKVPEEDEESQDVITDSSDEDIRPSFSQNIKKVEPPQTTFYASSEMAGLRTRAKKTNPLLMDQGIANWEKHNKGIGSKLMLQMGYQPGKGLGKALQGIDAPIEAHLRKGRGAIGAYGPEKKTKKMACNELPVKEIQQSEEKSERSSLWRKETFEKTKKTRYVYKTVDDVIEDSKKTGQKKFVLSELSQVKVIDMTGPEQRILSGYHAIAGVQKPTEEWEIRKNKKFSNFALPELLHNLNLLVDVSEQAIIDNDRKLMYADDRSKVLQEQVINLSKTVKQEKYIIDKLEKMITEIELVVPSANENSLTLEKAEKVFSTLKESHYAEFCAYEIPLLAVNVVRPLFNSFLEDWNPLQEPKRPLPEFVKWRSILLLEDSPNPTVNSYKLNPYYKLIWDTWVPCVRNAISKWECRQWAPMVDVIMNWMPLLSTWILDNILQDMIMKRIQQQVDEWNPMTDPVPIHSWIYPWINLLGKSFETTVYPTSIRQKIGRALANWHPSDDSARVMLQPWTSVFDRGTMEAFLVNYIVPKLDVALGQEFVINPHQQCLDQWNWVMQWSEMIPASTMAALLDRCFFPKWLQTLSVWLNLNPDMDQVSKWFRGWESIIQENIRKQPIVQDHLCTAVEIMNGATEGGNAIPEPRPARKMTEPIEAIRPLEVPLTLKSIVQSRCEERGILWLPIPNRFMDSKQVFRCGKLQVYFDRNALLVSQGGGSFTPMSWQEMLENAI